MRSIRWQKADKNQTDIVSLTVVGTSVGFPNRGIHRDKINEYCSALRNDIFGEPVLKEGKYEEPLLKEKKIYKCDNCNYNFLKYEFNFHKQHDMEGCEGNISRKNYAKKELQKLKYKGQDFKCELCEHKSDSKQ